MDSIVFFFMCAVVVGILAKVGIELMDYSIKKRLIKTGQLDFDIQKFFTRKNNFIESLKWGILLLFAGIGLIITGSQNFDWEKSAVPWGIETVFIALGFLVYYFIAYRIKDK